MIKHQHMVEQAAREAFGPEPEPTVIRSPWPAITYVALLYLAAIGVFLWVFLT